MFQEGGPFGLIQNGDIITIDIAKRSINVHLTDEEMNERRKKWTLPPYKADRGSLYKVCFSSLHLLSIFNTCSFCCLALTYSCLFSVHQEREIGCWRVRDRWIIKRGDVGWLSLNNRGEEVWWSIGQNPCLLSLFEAPLSRFTFSVSLINFWFVVVLAVVTLNFNQLPLSFRASISWPFTHWTK